MRTQRLPHSVSGAVMVLVLGASLVAPVQASGHSRTQTTTRLLVRYAGARPADRHVMVGGMSVVAHFGAANGAGIARVDVWPPVPAGQVAAAARTLGAAWVVPDRWVTPAATPNDPSYGRQWGLSGPYGIHADSAWPATTGSAAQTVAVVDTGYLDHADLAGQFVPGYDMVSCDPTPQGPDCSVAADGDGRDADPHDPGDTYVDAGGKQVPSSWHGTHVNGIVAALQNNNLGVTGVAPGVRIEPVRALGAGGGWMSDAMDAVTWAVGGVVAGVALTNSHPARVVNMSLESPGACDPATQAVLDFAYNAGAVVVVAAGNDNADASGYTPAGCRHVLTVGATTQAGVRAAYSNFGASVDVSAPGGDGTALGGIFSTYNKGKYAPLGSPSGDAYQSLSGTSMATPAVSGAVALMFSAFPAMTAASAYARLRDVRYTRPFAGGACDPAVYCGAGIVDAAALVGAVPVWSAPVATADGYTVSMENYNPAVTYAISSTLGQVSQTVDIAGLLQVTVSGVAPNTPVTLTGTASIGGTKMGTAAVRGASLCATVTPVLATAVPADGGFAVAIANYDPAVVWQAAADHGVATVAAGVATVTGLAGSQTAVVTVTAIEGTCSAGLAQATGVALPDVVLTAVRGVRVTRLRTGLRVSWAPPAAQDGRVIAVRVRISRVNSTRYLAWQYRGALGSWRTPALRHGAYRLQVQTYYRGRIGPVTTRRVAF